MKVPLGWRSAAALLLLLPVVFVVHSYPHVGASRSESALRSPLSFWERATDLVQGNDDPYPVHVDEHYHLARLAQIDREGEVHLTDPYTGAVDATPLFSLSGIQTERGWQVGLVQVHQLTGVAFPAMARFVPALWSTYLALAVWLAIRPGPGAAPAAAFVAIVPTTLRLLGPAFLVPSSFGLVWVIATLAVAHGGRGPGRFVALAVLMSGAFAVHQVIGILSFFSGTTVLIVSPGSIMSRLSRAGALFLPLVWLYPAYADDLIAQTTGVNTLSFDQDVFLSIGVPLAMLAAAGSAWAWMRTDKEAPVPRALSIVVLAAGTSIAWSLAHDHRNDATYTRLVPMFFLGLGILAGHGVAAVVRVLARVTALRPASGPIAAALVAVALLVPLQHAAAEPYYRVYDGTSWQWARGFEEAEPAPTDFFLSHPWQAPLFAAVSGARPHAYLLPGAPPVNGEDFAHYVGTGGADAAWLQERHIRYIIGPIPPNAPFESPAPGVYRLLD